MVIDAGVGYLGLKLEGSMVRAGGHFAAESKIMMKHASEVSAGRASGLAQSSIKHGSNQDFKHLADREYMANRVAFFGELLSKSATHTKSGITPIIQKELTDGD